MDTIPMQLDQLLTLALGVAFVMRGLKAAPGALDVHLGVKGAVVVSAVVSVALTALAYGANWAPASVPACDALAPPACVQGCSVAAGGELALANLLYAAVYRRVFRSRTSGALVRG